MGEAITEGDNTMREVVLRQPGYHTVLLHVRPTSHVHNQVARVLPVPVDGNLLAALSGVMPSHCGQWG